MKTIKHIVPVFIKLLFYNACFCQSETIDSLNKILPFLHDTLRVECLNNLSQQYIFSLKFDSALMCANTAYNESKKLNYIHGLARSYHMKASIAFKANEDYAEAEKLSNTSKLLFEKSSNKEGYNRLFLLLGWINFVRNEFENGVINFENCATLSRNVYDSSYLFYAISSSAMIFQQSGNYERAFEKAMEIRQMALQSNNKEWKTEELTLISGLYSEIEDFKTALVYYRQAIYLNAVSLMKSNSDADFEKLNFCRLFSYDHQFDSAKLYFNLVDTNLNPRIKRFYFSILGEYFLLQNENIKALYCFERALAYHEKFHDESQVIQAQLSVAKTQLHLKDYNSAFSHAQKGIAMAKKNKAKKYIRDGYEILASVYEHWHNTRDALLYYQKFNDIKDSVDADKVKGRLIAYAFDQKAELLNKENEMQQAKLKQRIQQIDFQKKLEQSKLKRQVLLKNILLIGLLVLLLLALIFFRSLILKRKNEKLENEKATALLQQQASELEMQALRAQMNPHFIFNCLNSINGFILTNETETAADYLTKFSRLIRMVLNNCQKKFITLDEDLQMLNLYLCMERLRFENSFFYTIQCDENIDGLSVFIPPMLLQPFAENAIRHGLRHKKENGKLLINLRRDNDMLECTITDNGVGRKKANLLKSKYDEKNKSMGLQITKSRINLLNGNINGESFFNIHDLENKEGIATGTSVHLKIKIRESAEDNLV